MQPLLQLVYRRRCLHDASAGGVRSELAPRWH